MDEQIKTWLHRLTEFKKEADLSRDEDLSIALMNLISLEEHFYFTAMKTQDQKYLTMLNSVRELRKQLLKKIVREPKGEEWCISKHLLAASMRLIEVGTKELSEGNTKDANALFTSGFDLYSLFFAINMKAMPLQKLEQHPEVADTGIMRKFSEIVKKIVDCCKE